MWGILTTKYTKYTKRGKGSDGALEEELKMDDLIYADEVYAMVSI